MIKSIFKLLLLITFLFLSSADLLAQVNWTKYPGNPVLSGQPGTWYAYTSMNSVLYNSDSSRYEMWFTAGVQVGYPYTIGFAWSHDGISWNVYSPNPVLTPTPGSWDAYMVFVPYVLRENGQYKMWYTGCSTNQVLTRIGYATSPDGINWTKHPSNPVLVPGTATWESAAVTYPCIIPYSNGYKMWYGGYNANLSVTGIGYATSPDGITWERYASNPVLPPGAGGQWDHVVFGSRVLFIDNNYYMFYTGETVVYQSDKIGLATSPDGLAWTKYPSNPVLKPTAGQWDGGRIEVGSVLQDADSLKMYYCGLTVGNTNMQLGLATSVFSSPLLPETYTVGTGGNFATIQDAFNKLETDGVVGNVTLELIDELYTAPTDSFGFKLNGPIPGAGPNSRVTIKPADNKNVVVEGNGRFVITCLNTSYTIVDGVSISGVTTLTLHAYKNAQYTWNGCLEFMNNSDHNIVQNVNFISDDIYGYGTGPSFITYQGSSATADSNLIQNNFIKKAGAGIYISSDNTTLRATGNIIRGNMVGSETDSLIGWGIQLEHCQNTIVENNIVQNLKVTHTIGEIVNMGINAWRCTNVIIRNNVVHGIRSNAGYMSVGILLSGIGGNNCQIYNNMIFDIQSSSTSYDSRVSGIQIFDHNSPKVYFNTVYLTGTGANKYGSAALYLYSSVLNADIKNNILVNMRDEGIYCASAMFGSGSGPSYSDYNDLYYDNTNSHNCLVRIGGMNYHTLAEWQATGKDLHSINKLVNFVSATDLHLAGLSIGDVDLIGTPIANITTDIDGNTRSALYPYKGADEASVVLPVELVSFTAQAENQQVILKWITASELNNNGFEVQRGINKTEFATIGFVRGEGTTTNQKEYSYIDRELADGKYYYRLKQIDYNGNYEYSKAIEIDVRILDEYTLEQNYPNPFNPVTIIGYVLKENANAKLVLLNAIGEEIAVLVNEEQDKGYHKVEFNAKELSSGVYFYQLRAVDPSAGSGQVYVQTKKMILLK